MMEILVVLVFLSLLLSISTAALSTSFFMRGRHRGMQEAAAEIIRGVNSHFEVAGRMPMDVSNALKKLGSSVGHVSSRRQLKVRHAQLWIFGDALGNACWKRGYRLGKLSMAPRDGNTYVELSANELLQLAWLAHLGFQHMMPNYRGFESYRFSGEEDARNSARAIERLEASIAARQGPVDAIALSNGRLALIENWWSERKLAAV